MKEHWGKQAFLNSVHSRDDGWFKFGLELEDGDRKIEVNSKFCISDCSNKMDLDFGVYAYKVNSSLSELEEELETLRERRNKALLLRESIDEWHDEITEMYDAFERKLKKFIKAKKKDEKKS